jgi:hypothetical protein
MSLVLSNFFEASMLIAFGCAWPPSIYKSYKTRSSSGKSLLFLYIIFLGYVFGILHQLLAPLTEKYVLVLFIINTLMVALDIMLYYRNRWLVSS